MQRRLVLQASAAAPPRSTLPLFARQSWPTGPVRVVVGFPPGGGTDALARVIGQKLSVICGQRVIVETRAGVAGVLAADYVAQQPGDGSVLLMAHISFSPPPGPRGALSRSDACRRSPCRRSAGCPPRG